MVANFCTMDSETKINYGKKFENTPDQTRDKIITTCLENFPQLILKQKLVMRRNFCE